MFIQKSFPVQCTNREILKMKVIDTSQKNDIQSMTLEMSQALTAETNFAMPNAEITSNVSKDKLTTIRQIL